MNLVRIIIEKIEGLIFTGAGFVGQTLKGELWQHYGFASRPRKGSKGVALTLKNGSFLIATSDPERTIEINDGEVCVHASPDVKILLTNDNTIEMTASAVKINSEKIELGKGTLEKMIKGETFMELYNSHIHYYEGEKETLAPVVPMTEILNLSAEVKNS
jgi:hypothetical protein